MADGWIKLHRKSIESRVFSDAALWRLWTWCLLRANHATGYFDGHEIEAGSFATGTRTAGETLSLSPSTIHRGLKRLAEWDMVTLKVKRTHTIVTICNYSTYQDVGGAGETPEKRPRNAGDANVTYPCSIRDVSVKPNKKNKNNKNEEKNKKGDTPLPPELPPSIRTDAMTEAVSDWLAYKTERREGYKSVGLRNFLSQVSGAVAAHGEAAIIARLRKAMASGWKGWDFADSTRGSPNGADDPRGNFAAANQYLESLKK
jgi:hypothetical protein